MLGPRRIAGLFRMPQTKTPIAKSLCSRFSAMLLCFVAGCARYSPMPLNSAVDDRGEATLRSDSLRVRARELKHPILRPIELNPANGVTPDQAAVLAVLLNPALRAARDQRNVAAAQVLAAGILPNPQLTFSEDLANGGLDAQAINAYGIGVNWDITQLITHDAKLRAARSGGASIELGIAWQEWQVAQAAKTAVYDLISLRDQLELAREIDRRLGENAGLVRASVNRHEKTLVDQAAADAASQDAHTALLSAERDLRHQRLMLNRAIGVDAEVEVTIDPRTTLPSRVDVPGSAELLRELENRRLDLVALRRGYESQEQTLRAAILAQFPKINIGINKQRDNTDVKSIGFTASVDLPIFDHNQGDIATQAATRQVLFDEYSQRRYEARSDVVGALDDIAAIEDLLVAAEAGIPSQQRLVDTYKTALNLGNVDVLSYYTAIGDLQQKKLNVIKLKQQLVDNRIALEIAAGEYLPGPGGPPATQPATMPAAPTATAPSPGKDTR
jgi:outer membrane protein, heavy metal efflux system